MKAKSTLSKRHFLDGGKVSFPRRWFSVKVSASPKFARTKRKNHKFDATVACSKRQFQFPKN